MLFGNIQQNASKNWPSSAPTARPIPGLFQYRVYKLICTQMQTYPKPILGAHRSEVYKAWVVNCDQEWPNRTDFFESALVIIVNYQC